MNHDKIKQRYLYKNENNDFIIGASPPQSWRRLPESAPKLQQKIDARKFSTLD